jgi:hypothetical protein
MTASAQTRPTAWFVALGTGSSDTGLTGEPSGNGYARQSASWTVVNDLAENSALLTFGPCTTSAWGTMTHCAVFDAVTGGNLLWHGAMSAGVAIAVADSLTFAAGAFDLTMA